MPYRSLVMLIAAILGGGLLIAFGILLWPRHASPTPVVANQPPPGLLLANAKFQARMAGLHARDAHSGAPSADISDVPNPKSYTPFDSRRASLAVGQAEKHISNTPLDDAITVGDLPRVKALLDGGADLAEQDGYGPLSVAATYDRLDIARYLIGRGADVNQLNAMGLPPLAGASQKMHVDMIALLLDARATAGVGDALIDAVMQSRSDVIETMLAHGVNVNARNFPGMTALHWAAARNNSAMIKFLLSHGADQSARSAKGETAADLARRMDHADAIALLTTTTAGK